MRSYGIMFLTIISVFPASAAGQAGVDESLPPLSLFFADADRHGESISPSGKQIAWLGPDERKTNRLWVADIEGPLKPVRIPAEDGEAVGSFFWLRDDKLLWQSSDHEGRTRLFTHDPGNDRVSEILANETRSIRLEGVADSTEPCVLVTLSESPSPFTDLYRVILGGNPTPELVCENQYEIMTWAWDRAGKPVSGLRWTNTGAKELMSFRGDATRVVFRVEPADDLRLVMASPDGKRALVITDRDSDLTHLEWIDLASGARQRFGADPAGRIDIEALVLSPDDILAVSYSEQKLRWNAIDPGFSKLLEALDDPTCAQSINILGVDASRRHILYKRFSGRDPGTVNLHDARTGSSRILWRVSPGIESSAMCESAPTEYPARDGYLIPAYLTLPTHVAKPMPLVVFPHGGPRMRTHAGFDARVQFLASRGYAVLQPNFRGSRGYGKAFMNAGDCQWGRGVMQNDVTDGVDYLVRQGLVDPRRVAILGGSYGGYAALAGLAFTPDRYAAGVCLFGISDLLDFSTHTPAEWQGYTGDTVRRLGNPFTEKGRNDLIERSPACHASAFKAPLLIYHGARDELIPMRHARQMADALQRNRKSVDFLLARDEGHGFSRPESEMAVYRAIELFLHEHLGGKVGPAPSETVTRRLMEFHSTGKTDCRE